MTALLAFLKKRLPSPRTVVVLTAIALIPLIYAGSLIWANQDPTHRLDHVAAAIVDEDAPATPDKDGAEPVDLGADLVDELTSNDEDTNFSWREMEASEAEAALDAGDVLAVLTIPSDFSSAAVSTASEDPADAVSSRLRIQTNDGANLIVGNIASTVGNAVTHTVAGKVSDEYLKNVYVGFTDIHRSVSDAADGAADLDEGAQTAKSGAGELVLGLGDLRDGSRTLASKAGELAAGAATAGDGAQRLSEGAASLDAGAQRLSGGAATAKDGARKLSDGLTALKDKTSGLSSKVGELDSGAVQTSDGAAAAAVGAKELADGAHALSDGAAKVSAGSDDALAGAEALSAGATAANDGSGQVTAGIDQLIANYTAMTDAQRLAALSTLSDGSHGVTDGTAQLVGGTQLLIGDARKGTGLAALQAGAHSLASGASDAASGADALAAGTAQVAGGASQVAGGVDTLAGNLGPLVGAIGDASTGASQVADGTAQLSDGAAGLASGTATLASGSSDLANGTAALASGASALASGAGTLAGGVDQATSGAGDLSDGLGTLADGTDELSSGLAKGVADIPSYTDAQKDHLASVASDPVEIDAQRVNEVPGYGYGLAPYFMALALWVGALAFYLMTPALRERLVRGRRPIWAAALGSYAPGAVMALAQSLLMVLIVRVGLGVEVANLPGLIGIAVLTSVTFVAINQAFIALLDAPGRFLALLLIVLQLSSAGGTYPIETSPAFFQVLHGILPLTYAVEAFRSLIAGGSIGIGTAVWVLGAWLIGALAVTTLAVWIRRRTASAPALRPVTA